MCDVKNTRFFRPWNGEEVSPTIKKTLSCEERVKCEPDEDSESVHSNDSVSHQSEQSESGSRSSFPARSCSIHSEDSSETSSLNMLSNFVFNAHPENHASNHSAASSISAKSCRLENSHQSAYANYYNSYPIYSSPDYLSHFKGGLMPIDASGIPFDGYHHLHYGLTGIPPEAYSSVEEAVKFIHQQDVAAKQMKKLRPKKFRCEHCNVAFSNNGQLKGHIRIHTGERPFKCDAEGCGKSFTRNEELTRHKRIHTGLRPHSCIVCGKRFGRKDHLKKHTRTHENRGSYHIPGVTLGPFAIGHPMPPAYLYPL